MIKQRISDLWRKWRQIITMTVFVLAMLAMVVWIWWSLFSVDRWVKKSNETYYLLDGRQKAVGTQQIDGVRYHFDADGALQYGWLQLEEGTAYAEEQTGALQVGVFTVNGQAFCADEQGYLLNGLITFGDKQYISDEKGALRRGIIQRGDAYYCYGDDYSLQIGLFRDGTVSRYADANGVLQSGLVMIEGRRYYFDQNFCMLTGWQSVEGKAYYFVPENGAAAVGWVTIADKLHYFDHNAVAPKDGFVDIDGETYYFEDGTYRTGWVKIKKKDYFFGQDGKMLRNAQQGMFWLGSDGVAVKAICTPANLNAFLDELLEKYGTSPEQIYKAVRKTMRYKYNPEGETYEQMACDAINKGKGACWNFASLGYCLLRRAGYEVYFVAGTGRNPPNQHRWLYVKHDDGKWYYMDPVYPSASKLSAKRLKALKYRWDESKLPENKE